MSERLEIADLVIDIARQHAESYRRAVGPTATAQEMAGAEACATAASNTGFHILIAMGFSGEQIVDMAAKRRLVTA